MLADATDIVRLSLHVAAAAVWVGGQATLAGLVPELRREAPGGPGTGRPAVRPAGVAGIRRLGGHRHIIAVGPSSQGAAWRAVLAVKIVVVLLSGLTAWLHQRATTIRGRAVWGAFTSLSALSALVLGVALAG